MFAIQPLDFLRRQHNFFLLDGFTHIVNILLYSPSAVGWPLYVLWIIMVIGHGYYYNNLKRHPPPARGADNRLIHDDTSQLSRIFHWSCLEFRTNRFSFGDCAKEMLETTGDIVAHSIGFLLAFHQIESIGYKLVSILLTYALLHRSMLGLKSFVNDPRMMPSPFRRFCVTL